MYAFLRMIEHRVCKDALDCSGLLWAALGCCGMLWAALGCSGLLWSDLGYSELLWAALGCSGMAGVALNYQMVFILECMVPSNMHPF